MGTVPESIPGTFCGGPMSRTNIKDIAKAAGVAVSTVSRVLNDHPDVKKETKDRILRVMKELKYVPNNSARNLKIVNSKSIGVFVRGEFNPFFAEIIEVIESRVSKEGYSVIVHYHHVDSDEVESAVQFILEKRLLGLIYLGGVITKGRERFLDGIETPIVFASTIIDEDVNKELFSSVVIDDAFAVKEVVESLISLGHEKIGIISAEKVEKCAALKRYDAFVECLKENNLKFNKDYGDSGDYSFRSGYEVMNSFIDKGLDITAVFAVNDMMAIGAVKALFDRGFNVPEDMSVVGFDGMEYGEFYQPSLTTVKQPIIDFGDKSCDMLFGLISEKSSKKHIVLDTELVLRDSCRSVTV